MPDTPERLAARLQSEGQKTLVYFRGIQPAEWQMQLYADGSCWSIKQVLAHFVSSEAAFTKLINNILAGGAGSPQGFDIDVFNETEVAGLKDLSPEILLQKFEELRQASSTLVAQMSIADLSRTGRHPFLGVVPLEEIVKLLYRHNQIHQRDVRKLLAPLKSGVERPSR